MVLEQGPDRGPVLHHLIHSHTRAPCPVPSDDVGGSQGYPPGPLPCVITVLAKETIPLGKRKH